MKTRHDRYRTPFTCHDMRRPLASRYVDGRIYVAGLVLIATSAIAAAPLLPLLPRAIGALLSLISLSLL